MYGLGSIGGSSQHSAPPLHSFTHLDIAGRERGGEEEEEENNGLFLPVSFFYYFSYAKRAERQE